MTSRSSSLRAIGLAALLWMGMGAVALAQAREVTLDEVLAYAEGHAPSLLRARAHLEEGEAARAGASPLLRDGLSITLGAGPRIQDDGQGDYDMLIGVSQPLEVGGQRGTRLDAADRLMAQRDAELESIRWQVHCEIHLAYHRALHDHARIQSEDRWITLGQQVVRIATARAQVGEGAPIERVIAEAELARARQRRLVAQADYQSAIFTLAEISGWNPAEPPEPTGGLDAPDDLPDDDRLIAVALDHHPMIRALDASAAAARAVVVRADRDAIPTISLGVQLSREGSAGSPANYIGLLMLGVALPVWQQNTEERAMASAALSIAEAESTALRSSIGARVRRAASTVRLTAQRLRLYEHDVLPGFGTSLDGLTRAYEVGEIDLATLSAGRQTLLAVQVDALDAYTEYHDALAELETQLGTEIDMQERDDASPSASTSDGSGGAP